MGKGMTPKKGYNDKAYKDNYDGIDWSSTRKNKQGYMNSATKVHEDKRGKLIDKIHNDEIESNE
tara:strand:+ start:1375 stop:1566 length:192 start_codon:yes stop_codon:yes gene_type:complete